jgi:hypothetical protein
MAIQIVNKKRFILLIGVVVVLIAAFAIFGIRFSRKEGGKKESQETLPVYEAMIETKGQNKYQTDEDKRTFLENGDVMVIFPEGHPWTEAEKGELIIKLRITPEQAQQLVQPEIKEQQNDSATKTKSPETIRLRQYRLKLETLQYDPAKSNEEQNFSGKVFEDDLIEIK